MKKTPKLFKNENINPINNNKLKTKVIEKNNDKYFILNKIFSNNKPYDIRVIIETKEETIEDYILAKNNINIYTLSNRTIPIEEIIEIKIKD